MTISALASLGIRRANLGYYVRTGQAVFSAPIQKHARREGRSGWS